MCPAPYRNTCTAETRVQCTLHVVQQVGTIPLKLLKTANRAPKLPWLLQPTATRTIPQLAPKDCPHVQVTAPLALMRSKSTIDGVWLLCSGVREVYDQYSAYTMDKGTRI